MIREILRDTYHRVPFKPAMLRKVVGALDRSWRSLNANRVVTKTIDGVTFSLDLNELIDSSIYFDGSFEPCTTRALLELAKPGMVVFDIGANVGAHTLPLARAVGEKGQVFAFEPMPWARAKLKKNIGLNEFQNIKVEPIALSDKSGQREIHFRTSWTIDGRRNADSEAPALTDFLTLDQYIETRGVPRVDLIKLDVDGFEYKVFQGAERTLKKNVPAIVMELADYTLKQAGDSIDDLLTAIFRLGYTVCRESDMRKFRNPKSIVEAIPDRNTTTINVVLLHPSNSKRFSTAV